jgi:hypothetical protein
MKNFIWQRSAACAFLFLGACSSAPRGQPDYHIRFVTPQKGTVLTGFADVELDIVIPEAAERFEIGTEGGEAKVVPQLANTLRLDSRQFKNGQQQLVARVTGESGQQWSDSISVEIRNPDFDLLSYAANSAAYSKGDAIVLKLKYPLAGLSLNADFTPVDDQFKPAAVAARELGDGAYELSYTLSSSDAVTPGQYDVTIIATNSAHETASSLLPIRLHSGPRLPLTIANGVFVDGDVAPVFVSSQPTPVIQQLSGVSQLVSGTPQNLTVAWTAPADHPADRIFIRAEGYSGYYVVPAGDAVAQQMAIPLNLQFAQNGSNGNGGFNLSVAVADGLGAIGSWVLNPVVYQFLSPYGASATLSWNSAADLDLKVTTPIGSTITYRTPSVDGGRLELDANGLCTKSQISAERVFWAPGDLIPGRYTVVADIYGACGSTGADYTAVLFFCGKTQTILGHFSSDDVGTDQRSRTVATIDVDCVNHVYGTVSYEQLANHVMRSPYGLAAYVPIRAISTLTSDQTPLAETTTDGNGRYDLYLPVGAGQNYSLEVETSFTLPGQSAPFASVWHQDTSSVYRLKYTGVDTNQKMDTEQNILVKETEGSGALNILQRIAQAYFWVMAHFSTGDASKVPAVVARWSRGMDSPAQPGMKPPYRSYRQGDVIYIGGLEWDTNEQDDSVIAHEFFHHVAFHLGLPVVGGAHDTNTRAAPSLALSEGLATALGQQSLGYPVYSDTFDGGVFQVDLENRRLPDRFVQWADYGTSDDTMSGNLNEILVAAVLWDLMDPIGGSAEPSDLIDSTYNETLGSIAHYLPLAPPNRVDRGAPGVDLVDLLDGWRCRCSNRSSDDAKLRTLLNERRFNYEFASAPACH